MFPEAPANAESRSAGSGEATQLLSDAAQAPVAAAGRPSPSQMGVSSIEKASMTNRREERK
jgi:hypothetical protein